MGGSLARKNQIQLQFSRSMTEELGLGLEETASVDMLPGGGGCDSGSRPMARAGLEARSHRRSWTHTCCLLLLPILTGLFTYLFVSQLWAQGEDCVLDQIPKEKEFLPSHQRAYILPSRADGGKPRAHLTVIKQPPTHPSKNQLQAMHWEHELGLAFTKNRMNYTNKFLVVPESGDYFIYTQITFRGTSVECGDMGKRKQSKPDSIIVVITKVTDRYPEPSQLLMGTKSVCEISGNWFQPLYLGAMFSLQEGDKLMVNVSDISLVDYTREDKTFFGAFLL